jgi:hypothetical protein
VLQEGVFLRWAQQPQGGGRPRHRRDPQGPGKLSRRRVPRGPVLPDQRPSACRCRPCATARTTCRCSSTTSCASTAARA